MSICDGHADSIGADSAPLVRVLRGAPTPDEVAALVGVLLARRRSATGPATSALSSWAFSGRPAALAAHPGQDAWRRSGLPG